MAAAGVAIAQKDDSDTHSAGVILMTVSVIGLLFLVLNLVFIIVLLVGLHKVIFHNNP